MGATTFQTIGKGRNADEAFRSARDQAAWEHGHGGYTGTLAEKHDFTVVPFTPTTTDLVDQTREAYALADRLIQDDDSRISDKWGPAGCIKMPDGNFLFFGWASS